MFTAPGAQMPFRQIGCKGSANFGDMQEKMQKNLYILFFCRTFAG